jgi:hypothetical protein
MDDQRLKSAFGELRAHERAQAPALESLLTHVTRKRVRRSALLVSALAAATAAVFVVFWPRPTADDVAPLTITQWRAPTDVLLQSPNWQLLSELGALEKQP